MGAHYLDCLFAPRGIAVFGASERRGALGTQVFRNLLRSGFEGKLYPVNPKHRRLRGRSCYPALERVPGPVDLAVLRKLVNTALRVKRSGEVCLELASTMPS